MKRLTTLDIMRLPDGMHHDAAAPNLYLQVRNSGASRVWIYRFALDGKPHWYGIGRARAIPLARARQLANEARALVAEGVNPIERRRERRGAARVEQAKAMTFQQCAEAYIAAHEAGWRNPTHRQQWSASLSTYAYPTIGALPVAAVDVGQVLRCIEPIWTAKPETANRTRQRLENVLDYARARGYRHGENPARWKGNLDHLLPAKAKLAKVKHFAALPHDQIGAFMAVLRAETSTRARALEFTILCAARTGSVLGARFDEIDIEAKVWTVPAERMKGDREHRVPLSPRAIEIVRGQQARREGPYVFPGRFSGNAPLSPTSLLDALRVMGRTDVTVHGTARATFKTWASEDTNFQREVVEAALAHIVGDATERAYARGDALDKRRKLMDAWAAFCSAPTATGGKVLALRATS